MHSTIQMAYVAVEVTDQLLENTAQAWKLIAGADAFDSEYLHVFEWMKTNRNYGGDATGSCAYGLVEEELGNVAVAFYEVVASENMGGLNKLLKVFVTPSYWNLAAHQSEVIKVYVACVINFVGQARNKSCRTIKIYGRGDAMLSLLRSLHVALQKQLDENPGAGLSVSIDGRWLVLSVST